MAEPPVSRVSTEGAEKYLWVQRELTALKVSLYDGSEMTEFRRFAEQQRQERGLADVLSSARMMDARGEQPGPFGSDGNELGPAAWT